jgi:hypothetical protein
VACPNLFVIVRIWTSDLTRLRIGIVRSERNGTSHRYFKESRVSALTPAIQEARTLAQPRFSV